MQTFCHVPTGYTHPTLPYTQHILLQRLPYIYIWDVLRCVVLIVATQRTGYIYLPTHCHCQHGGFVRTFFVSRCAGRLRCGRWTCRDSPGPTVPPDSVQIVFAVVVVDGRIPVGLDSAPTPTYVSLFALVRITACFIPVVPPPCLAFLPSTYVIGYRVDWHPSSSRVPGLAPLLPRSSSTVPH